MDYSEKWGKDVDEAVRLALEDLELTEDQVMVTVLEEPAKGFLGLGSKLAKVRVEKIAIQEEEKTFSDKGQKANSKVANVDFRKKNKPQGNRSSSDRREDRGNRADRPDRNGRGRNEDRKRSEDRGRGEDKFRKEKFDDIPDLELPDKPVLSERPENLVEVERSEASLFLSNILENMQLNVTIKAFTNDECVYIEVEGEDANAVIGKRGQTLDSIQYLTNLVSNKEIEAYKRVIIDVEGYRSRREKTLERLALKLAKKVLKTGRNEKLEPMNPYERKVIHSTLQSIEGITTKSEGDEPYRRVVIEKNR
jgi:spoIIIJ-associated protein